MPRSGLSVSYNHGMTTPLVLQITTAAGVGERVVSEDDYLVAAFRRSVQEGKHTGKWCFVAISEPGSREPRVLGTLLRSVGSRTIFYPSTPIKFDADDHDYYVDHVSLDSPIEGKWASHVTYRDAPRRRKHTRVGRPHAEGGCMAPWMSIIVSSVGDLPALPKTLKLSFSYPGKDLGPFAHRAFEGQLACRPILIPTTSNRSDLYQFDLFVGRGSSWRELRRVPVTWDPIDGILSEVPTEPYDRTAGELVVPFAEDLGARVLATRLSGQLSGSVMALHPEIELRE